MCTKLTYDQILVIHWWGCGRFGVWKRGKAPGQPHKVIQKINSRSELDNHFNNSS